MTSNPGTGPRASARPADPRRQVRTEPIDPSGRPDFAAIVHGVDLTRELGADEVDAIHAAIDRYGVLVFRDQHLDDAQQVAFSRQLGPLELATGDIGEVKDRRLPMELNDISNLDKHGEVLPRDNRARLFGLGNRLWHSDSSFKAVPAKYSLLSARKIPSSGGNTEFADMRAAYDALDDAMKAAIADLKVHHSIAYSREVLGFEFQPSEKEQLKGAVHPLVRHFPRTGRRGLYLASHASSIIGWRVPEGRLLLRELMEHATQPRFVYSHRWSVGDFVIWDNRATMHRARPFDDTKYRRELRRTTTLDIAPAAA